MIWNFKDRIGGFCSIFNHAGGYLINDPTTPDLSESMAMPTKGLLDYAVSGLSPEPSNSHEKRALNCHFLIGNCLNELQKHAKSPVMAWANRPVLEVYPAAGRDMNAYYDRRSLKFFYYPHNGRNVYFADSADIVTHELGHAYLDAMRPDFWSVQSLEIWAFHEAFSDIVAMFNLMNYEKAMLSALKETGGDLGRSNVISRLAEEVGVMIRRVTGDPTLLLGALRDPATEVFKYVDPHRLPAEAPNDRLASECHSFGRVFSGAWYEIFARMFETHSKKMDAVSAFRLSRDTSFSILMHAIPMSPKSEKYYSSVARAMLAVAKGRGDDCASIVASVFSEWNLLPESELKIQESSDIRSRVMSELNRSDYVFKWSEGTSICLKRKALFGLGNLPIVSSLSVDPLVKVEVPMDQYYEFDASGNLAAQVVPDEDSVMKSVAACLSMISKDIGEGRMWNVERGILRRQFVV